MILFLGSDKGGSSRNDKKDNYRPNKDYYDKDRDREKDRDRDRDRERDDYYDKKRDGGGYYSKGGDSSHHSYSKKDDYKRDPGYDRGGTRGYNNDKRYYWMRV